MRYLLELSYKGTAYHGWQKQHNAHSVQAVLDEKLSLLIGENIETLGCGRTDTGVHAKQFFAHFDTEKPVDPAHIVYKLNHILPVDISIHGMRSIADDFNARFDAAYRTYEYHISRQRDPFATDVSCYLYGPLNVEVMNECAALLIGQKDFECFSKVHTQVNNFICDVMLARWEQQGDKLIFTIRANRFLRNMVRAVVGTLVEVGRGRISVDGFKAILESKNRSEAGQSVPAQGLFLTEVVYEQ
jgi:tRNA pseudouridine38-40 synthase